jgi:hypothetical protein
VGLCERQCVVSPAADDIAQAQDANQRDLCKFESEIMHNVWYEVENMFDVNEATHGDQIQFY